MTTSGSGTSTTTEMPDIQSETDRRRVAIDKVGVKEIQHPVTLATPDGDHQETVGIIRFPFPDDREITKGCRIGPDKRCREGSNSEASVSTIHFKRCQSGWQWFEPYILRPPRLSFLPDASCTAREMTRTSEQVGARRKTRFAGK